MTDEFGNPVAGVDVEVDEVGIEGGTIDEGDTEVATGGDGIATFGNLVIEDADDSYQLEFSIDESDGNVESSDTDTTDEFDIDPAAADEIASVDVADEEFAYDAGSTTVTVEAEDEFGNPLRTNPAR
ncbi:hypothetical protein D8S78_24320 [Natrialba swarupiae]|nr:hypothetical protein [Natrialba swarupiae]